MKPQEIIDFECCCFFITIVSKHKQGFSVCCQLINNLSLFFFSTWKLRYSKHLLDSLLQLFKEPSKSSFETSLKLSRTSPFQSTFQWASEKLFSSTSPKATALHIHCLHIKHLCKLEENSNPFPEVVCNLSPIWHATYTRCFHPPLFTSFYI